MSSSDQSIRGMVGDVGSIASAVLVVGVSYGALASEAGLPAWLVIALAVAVLAASAELMFIASILVGAAPLAAALGALLVNLRNGVYGIAGSKFLRGGWTRLLAAHFVNDETVAYASARHDPLSQRRAFWVLGWAILLAWPAGAAIGVILGRAVTDVSALGLDAVFPAILFAMVLGAVRSRRSALIVACGALIAVGVTPFVPPGVAPLVALVSLALLWKRGSQRG
ncbi:AzlC family ABC transporter permease [Kocuria sp. CCUG 69068]|uniref:AzlC family ABC transporter permease n=1 Tax=Kocuria sp. CCUG 69068 TaxID=2043138 RepID=UPI001E506A23